MLDSEKKMNVVWNLEEKEDLLFLKKEMYMKQIGKNWSLFYPGLFFIVCSFSSTTLTYSRHTFDIPQAPNLGANITVKIECPEQLATTLSMMMKDQDSECCISQGLCECMNRCYEQLIAGKRDLVVDDMLAIMPLLIEFATKYEETKALRPDAQTTENGAITACCGCDLTQVLAILAAIKSRIAQELEILINLTFDNCNPIYLTQANFNGGATFVINTPGVYKFAQNIVFTPGPGVPAAIQVNVSNVIIDLQCFIISQVGGGLADGVLLASGVTNVDVRNGEIVNFSNSAINTLGPVSLVNISNVTCRAPARRGIQLKGTALTNCEQCTIKDCVVINGCISALADHAIFCQFCTDLMIENCDVKQCGSVNANINGVRLQNCTKASVLNVTVDDNRAGNVFRGYSLNATIDSIFQNCQAKRDTSNGNIAGFFLESGSASTENQFANCIALALSGTAAVDGFLTDTGCNNNIFVDCKAFANNSSGAGATAIAHGFNFINNVNNTCIDCLAQTNAAPASVAGFTAFGFDFNTTTSCSLIRCIATDQRSAVTANSIGIRVINGNRNLVTDCKTARNSIGFRIDPNLTVNHALSTNLSAKDVTAYSQFPVGSTQIAGNITNINAALTNPWTNTAIG